MRAKVLGRCGVMITGSHNIHVNNGVKMFEPDASLFHSNWELLAEMLINSDDIRISINEINQISLKGFPDLGDMFRIEPIPSPYATCESLGNFDEIRDNSPDSIFPHVLIGRDSRSSSI